ncbi:MAG: hemerythrin domain-containing protein [Actinomycetales bacterium]|nr:hemerythrin domain-containing protein [Actinomycetales bacterium]
MCQYCGCQSTASVALLTAEHDAAVDLAGDIRRALADGDLPTAARRARRLHLLLGPHTAVEEDGLFPAMAGDFPEHVSRLREEHQEIQTPLAEAEESVPGAPVDPTWPTRLVRALDLLEEHVLTEQDGVFPAALAVLDPEQWARVDDIRSQVGTELDPGRRPTLTG